jgi:hypothetical protein
MGYADPLPAPSLAVQATIAAIVGPEVHAFIQNTDQAAILDKDVDGEHAPLLLSTLDLSHWTSVMYVATVDNGVEKALARLQEAHGVLANLLEKDEIELEEATNHARVVETALRAANPHEDWSDRTTPSKGDDSFPAIHPMLSKLNIPEAQKAAIEDYGDSIQSSQLESKLASLDAAGKGPAIPFVPYRIVEIRLNSQSHRTWCLSNINLLAPIPTLVWKIWANLTDNDVKACEDKAVNVGSFSIEGQLIANAFPLALYDHHKCTTTSVRVHTKQDVLTCPPRNAQHTSKLWNCRRPYLRCTYSQNAKSGCKGNMIWFDQATWFMMNNLERFFDSRYPSIVAKYGVFLTWISQACMTAVRAQITFITYRRLMEVAAVELAANSNDKLLAKYGKAAGARQVERFFKPASFSLQTTPSSSPAAYSKRRRLNMNVTPEDHHTNFRNQAGLPRNRTFDQRQSYNGGGRRRYNKNFKPAQRNNARFQQNSSPTACEPPNLHLVL